MITFKAKTATGEIINSALSPFQFPAGEAHTKREDRRELEPTEIAIIQPSKDSLHDDLFQLAMWNSSVSAEAGDTNRALVMPYAPGARADRGLPFGAGVYADFFNSLGIEDMYIFDPHSPTIVRELMDGQWMYTHILNSADVLPQFLTSNGHKYDAIIAPDKGATVRATKVASKLGIPVIVAEKTRDFETGYLSGFTIDGLENTKKYLLVDDICDAGGTFLGLAEETGLQRENLDLYVSHGVFSRNATSFLPERFGKVFTTNSYNPTRALDSMGAPDTFTRIDVIRPLLEMIK